MQVQSIFEIVKQEISPLEALEYYNFRLIKRGRRYWLLCPFHPETCPSMMVDDKIHCYGCGWHGDLIDFVAEYFHLQPLEAAQKLLEDFSISVENPRGTGKKKAFKQAQKRKQEEALYQAYLEAVDETYNFLCDLYQLYGKLKASVKTLKDLELEGVIEAFHNQELVGYWLDILTDGTPQEKLQVIQEVRAWTQKQK